MFAISMEIKLSAIIFVIVVCVLSVVKCNSICDQCYCLESEEDLYIVKCRGHSKYKTKIDFENIAWPDTNRSIKAFFNDLNLFVLPKILGQHNVISLNFDDNSIRTISLPNPFEGFKSLKELSISNNLISTLPKDFFKSCRNLEELKLVNNTLSELDPKIFDPLINLREIDLSLNEFTKLSAKFTEAIRHVEILYFEDNKIFTIETDTQKQYKWKELFLSKNHMKILTSSNLEAFKYLQNIDLSNNQLTNIDGSAFKSLNSLRLLELSHNQLYDLMLQLPDSLELLSVADNKLLEVPFIKTPNNLEVLELQNNKIEDLNSMGYILEKLKILNVSNNAIEILPSLKMPVLQILDLSANHLRAFPSDMATKAPQLEVLILDSNPMEKLEVSGALSLQKLSLRNIQNWQEISERAFENVTGIKKRSDGEGECLDLIISNCGKLHKIHENAFQNIEFCELDLSYNNLTNIPKNLTEWSEIEGGLNIQGNPFECSCENQWMLDILLNQLYEGFNEKFQNLLSDLRCDSPDYMKGHRFVRYYQHTNAFCKRGTAMRMEDTIEKSNFGGIFDDYDEDDPHRTQIRLNKGPGFVIIIVMCAVILIAMILVGIHWNREQNRRLARRNRIFEY